MICTMASSTTAHIADAKRVSTEWIERAETEAAIADAVEGVDDSDSSDDGLFCKNIRGRTAVAAAAVAEKAPSSAAVDDVPAASPGLEAATEADFHELLGATVVVHGLVAKPELNGEHWRCSSACGAKLADCPLLRRDAPHSCNRCQGSGHVVARQHRARGGASGGQDTGAETGQPQAPSSPDSSSLGRGSCGRARLLCDCRHRVVPRAARRAHEVHHRHGARCVTNPKVEVGFGCRSSEPAIDMYLRICIYIYIYIYI